MGCHIYAHVEIRVDDEWLYYAPARIRQWYELFAKMADVRNEDNEIEPISSPRGLPDDVSKMVMLHREKAGDGDYSGSWLSHAEICELSKWAEERSPISNTRHVKSCYEYGVFPIGVRLFGNTIQGWIEYPYDYPDFLQDIRLVFWFDS